MSMSDTTNARRCRSTCTAHVALPRIWIILFGLAQQSERKMAVWGPSLFMLLGNGTFDVRFSGRMLLPCSEFGASVSHYLSSLRSLGIVRIDAGVSEPAGDRDQRGGEKPSGGLRPATPQDQWNRTGTSCGAIRSVMATDAAIACCPEPPGARYRWKGLRSRSMRRRMATYSMSSSARSRHITPR